MNVSLIVEPEIFFNLFVPKPTPPLLEEKARHRPSNPFADMSKPTTERTMYEDYPKHPNEVIRDSGYVFVATSYMANNATDSELAFDCGMYPHTRIPHKDQMKGIDLTTKNDFLHVCWSGMDLPVKCMVEDLFEDSVDIEQPFNNKEVMSSLELVYHHQHRTFAFMLVFISVHCRLLRVDRSGLVVTKPFDITTTDYLVEFLWRYTQLSPEDRGHDTTAEYINPSPYACDPLARMMKDCLWKVERGLFLADSTLEGKSAEGNGGRSKGEQDSVEEEHVVELWRDALDEEWPWWKLRVTDQETGQDRWFLTGKPSFQAPGIRGRGTRCHIAVELLTDRDGNHSLSKGFVFLKDCWRVVMEVSGDEAADIQQEGTILRRLNEHNVAHVPTLVVHGDVPGQETSTPEAWNKVGGKQDFHMKRHRHYRLVVKEIGKPLSKFRNSGQLVLVMHDCLQAHSEAYKIGIMHRDISGGNVLLYNDKKGDWRGMLIDWELADVFHKNSTPKQSRRKARPPGTARFSAVSVLGSPSKKPVCVADEIESAFHVLVYYAVRFLQHNLPDKFVDLFFEKYFDMSSGVTPEGERMAPVLKRSSMELGRISLRQFGIQDTLRFTWVYYLPTSPQVPRPLPHHDHPLNDLLGTLLSCFKARYTLDFLDNESPVVFHRSPAEKGGEVAFRFDDDGDDDNCNEPAPSVSPPEHFSPSEMERMWSRATMLDDHAAILGLFKAACGKMYPRDKGEDKLKRPEKGYVPHSPETPLLSEVSGFADFEAESADSDGPLDDAPHLTPEASVHGSTPAELATIDTDGGQDGLLPATPLSKQHEDEREYSSRSQSSSCPNRRKRGREDGAGSDPSGKRATGTSVRADNL